ncbi:cysteine--tRNA ligase [Rickettsiales bacterium]|nr:cysteine--tRNA ligase [Rickettsiales bacterium]
MVIKFFNTLTKNKEIFEAIDSNHIRFYVCGPTVYSRPHIGNARSIVIYDLLYRFLQNQFPKVTYVRNITDVDDKINKAAKENNISIKQLTNKVIEDFNYDINYLNVLRPTFEPKATENISEIIKLIEKLIANNNAYISDGHVLFDVNSYDDYGKLSRRNLDEMIAGARVEAANYKKNPLDFVLWKPASDNDDISSIFDSPWSRGRPGWHIECSAMSGKFLGQDFDIHGGGADLQFPHHENEIAQSKCANHGSKYAKYWLHNGFLTVSGEKMSKSLSNFITIADLIDKNISGIIIRFLLLSTHYRKPLDYTKKALTDATKSIEKFYSILNKDSFLLPKYDNPYLKKIILSLSDDLNSPLAFSILHSLIKDYKSSDKKDILQSNLIEILDFLGLLDKNYFNKESKNNIDESYILEKIAERKVAKENKDYNKADAIRDELLAQNIIIKDSKDGTIWQEL